MLLVLVLEPAGAAGAMSIPTRILPDLDGVNRDGSSLKESVATCPGLSTLPGMIAKVLPCPELNTSRSSRTSGATDLRRRTRDNSFDGIMGPPWPATVVGDERSADPEPTDPGQSRGGDPPG